MMVTILTGILVPNLLFSSLFSVIPTTQSPAPVQPRIEFAQVLPDAFVAGKGGSVIASKQANKTPGEALAALVAPSVTPTGVPTTTPSPEPTVSVTTVPSVSPTAVPSVMVASSAPTTPSSFDSVYQDAGAKYGIPWQILYGLHITETGGRDGMIMNGSGSGARGPMQFMPGTWRAYGVDGNGDGVADIDNAVDAIHGAANYLAKHGSLDNGLRSYGGNTTRTLELAQARGYSQ